MKNKIIVVILIVLVLVSIVLNFRKFKYYSDSLDKDFSERLVVSQKFKNKLDNYNCKVKENYDERLNNKDVFYSYKSDGESCPFEIIYVAASNKEIIDNISQEFLNSMQSTNNTQNNRRYFGVQSTILENDEYKIVLYNKVCMLYLKTSIDNKDKAYDLLDELGYKSKMYN